MQRPCWLGGPVVFSEKFFDFVSETFSQKTKNESKVMSPRSKVLVILAAPWAQNLFLMLCYSLVIVMCHTNFWKVWDSKNEFEFLCCKCGAQLSIREYCLCSKERFAKQPLATQF